MQGLSKTTSNTKVNEMVEEKEKDVFLSITVKSKGIKYKGNFRKPDLALYKEYFKELTTDSLMADAILAEKCFVSGDKELIDFDNHIELLLSYRSQLDELIDYKEAISIDKEDIPKEYKNCELGIVLKDNDKEYKGYFRKPDFIDMRAILNLYDSGLVFEGNMEFARKCFLGGDKELILFKAHPNYFVSYKYLLSNTIAPGLVTLKKK